MRKNHLGVKIFFIIIIAIISASIFILVRKIENIPDETYVFDLNEFKPKNDFPISMKIRDNVTEVSMICNEKCKKYKVDIKVFGIKYKSVNVNVLPRVKVIPSGEEIGVYLKTKGVLVIDTGFVADETGKKVSPSEGIIKPDDYIVSLNGIEVGTKSQLIFLINKYGENDINLGIKRKDKLINVKITPVKTAENKYQLGIWIRDDSQGIGTLTYVTEDGQFGALGHGISDVDTGKLLESEDGILYMANVWGIRKGSNGEPGGVLGSINYEDTNILGTITDNTSLGIFGKLNIEKLENAKSSNPIDIKLKKEIKTGKAYIRSSVSGKVIDYEIEITKIHPNTKSKTKSMEIKITDKELLDLTNGILRGMSGSPILQDGKMVGAVTHVFVNEPTKGYAIFIENMLEH